MRGCRDQELTSRRRLLRSGAMIAAAVVAGCQNNPPRPAARTGAGNGAAAQTPVAPISNTDACATRLHEVCGPLLLYYATRFHLPEKAEELAQMPGFESVGELICPVSKRPYVYNPVGVITQGEAARVIMYDPAPSHSGMRWAVSIIEPQRQADPLITKVIALPESYFTLQIPR